MSKSGRRWRRISTWASRNSANDAGRAASGDGSRGRTGVARIARTVRDAAASRAVGSDPPASGPGVDEPEPAERKRHEKAQREHLHQAPVRRRRQGGRGSGPAHRPPAKDPRRDPGPAPRRPGEPRRKRPPPRAGAKTYSRTTGSCLRERGALAGMENGTVFLLTRLSFSWRRRPRGRARRSRARLRSTAGPRSPKAPSRRFRHR